MERYCVAPGVRVSGICDGFRQRRVIAWCAALVVVFVLLVAAALAGIASPEESIRPHVVIESAPPATRTSIAIDRVSVGKPSSNFGFALTGNRLFYIDSDGGLIARDIRSRRRLWTRRHVAESTDVPLAATNEQVFFATPDRRVAAVDSRLGRTLWISKPFRPSNDYYIQSIRVSDRVLYVSGGGLLAKLSATTGTIFWSRADFQISLGLSIGKNAVASWGCTCGGPPETSDVKIISAKSGNEIITTGLAPGGESMLEGASQNDTNVAFLFDQQDKHFLIGLTSWTGSIGFDDAVRIAVINPADGHVIDVKGYHPDPALQNPDMPAPSEVLVSADITVIRLRPLTNGSVSSESISYVYSNASRPATQHPLRLGDMGFPVHAVSREVWFLDSRGLSSARVSGTTAFLRRVADFDYDSSGSQHFAFAGNVLIAATTAGGLVFTNLVTGTTQRYTGNDCPILNGVQSDGSRIAVHCSSEKNDAILLF